MEVAGIFPGNIVFVLPLSFLQREVTQKNNLLSEKDTQIGEKDHRLEELVRQQEVRQLYCLYVSYVYISYNSKLNLTCTSYHRYSKLTLLLRMTSLPGTAENLETKMPN